METIIIATDFSSSSVHAARYALALAKRLEIAQVILYHSYDIPATVSTEIPAEPVNTAAVHEASLRMMEALTTELNPLLGEQTKLETIVNDVPLILGIDRLQEIWHAVLVVVGMTGKSGWQKFWVGSNTLNLAQTCPTNLLIIPEQQAEEIPAAGKAVFACDFDQVESTIPVSFLKKFVGALSLKLLVLNVAKSGARFDADMIPEQFRLHELLDEVDPAYHYTEHQDVAEGIVEFADEQAAGWIISVPKNYVFFDSILHRSVTKKLAGHTHLPLLLLK